MLFWPVVQEQKKREFEELNQKESPSSAAKKGATKAKAEKKESAKKPTDKKSKTQGAADADGEPDSIGDQEAGTPTKTPTKVNPKP